MSISAILLFIAILIVLVIVHEFGHFVVAKLTGMRVDEFAFGFPPRIFAKKIGETVYAFNAIPLGGYVSIWGENGSDEDKKDNGASTHPRAFGNRPAWAQLLVLVAGVTMNMVLALLIFIFISYGEVRISTDDPIYGHRVKNAELIVVDISKESPAFKAGVVPGSTITSVTSLGKKASIVTATSVISFIEKNQNSTFTIGYRTPDGQSKETSIAAVYGIVPDKKALGVALDTIGTMKTTLGESFVLGFERTVTMTELTALGLVDVISSLFNGDNVIDSLSGPVGIAKIVDETSNYGYVAVLTLVAILSINLAIFNILPLPALDGGRIVVVLIETIFRKKIPFNYYSWVNVAGFFLLILLLVVVTVHDLKG
ncbi:MAG: site-2 protease family protein [Candidatus Pacebacteria bacterium]|jgi:regulator of sigma E protease|nr:site-2 protease family protein [Candidatus Paceibacterota bacterium]